MIRVGWRHLADGRLRHIVPVDGGALSACGQMALPATLWLGGDRRTLTGLRRCRRCVKVFAARLVLRGVLALTALGAADVLILAGVLLWQDTDRWVGALVVVPVAVWVLLVGVAGLVATRQGAR